jgi:uncharacterized protein YkwD
MSRHARTSKPLSQPPATASAGRGRYSSATVHPLPVAAGPVSHRRSGRRAGTGGPARTVIAVCCTALAAGTGGVLSGLVPLPTGLPDTVVVAGDPGSARAGTESPGAGSVVVTDTRQPSPGASPSGGTATTAPTRPSPAAGRGQDRRPAPGTTATATAPAAGTPVITAEPTGAPAPTAAAPSASSSTVAPTPTGSAADSTTAASGRSRAAVASAVLTLVNQERAKAGCTPLTTDARLAALATAFSDDMAARGFFDHTDPDGKTPWDRAQAAGISDLGGENIARGQQTAADVMTAWMNSPGHRANILNCDYHTLGVGIHEGADGPWWTQDFGF